MQGLSQWFSGIDLVRVTDWILYALAALLAISVHESSHALSALWLGDDTAKRMGRISLNPLHHLDPYGFFLMVVAHFGWAKPVPVNPYRMTRIKNPKLTMALTAVAGPISNILLAFLSCIAYALVFYKGSTEVRRMLLGYAEPSGALYYLGRLFLVSFVLNAGLAVFNLIPISPLDGSKVLAIVLPRKAHAWLMRYERYGFLVLMLLMFTGILSGPITFLRDGLMDGILKLADPIAKALAGL